MGERTIKGVPVSEVLRKIAEKREPDDYLMNKYPYYKMETYHDLLEKVIGSDHYNVDIVDRHYTVIANQQELFSVCVRITLLDDNYQEICHKDGYGGREVQYSETSGKDGGIKNIENNAALSAFKAAWQQFGIFGTRCCDDNVGRSTSQPTHTPRNNSINSNNPASEQSVTLISKGYVREERMDERTGKTVYKLKAVFADTNKSCEVIFYPNQYSKCSDLMEKFIARCQKKETTVTMICSEGKAFNGVSQLIFKGFK